MVAASVVVQKGIVEDSPSAVVVITGDITAQDSADLAHQLQGLNPEDYVHRMAFLSSPGGDVRAAMEMGQALRAAKFDAFVLPNMQCLSSCIYLLAAGLNKTVRGEAGIHRPYFTSNVDVSMEYKRLIEKSRDYFAKLNIPERLADDMFSTPPSDMKILTATELRSYRLDQADIVADEIRQLEMAKELSVDRPTMVQFNADINAACTPYQGDARAMSQCMCEVSQSYPVSIQRVACATPSGAK